MWKVKRMNTARIVVLADAVRPGDAACATPTIPEKTTQSPARARQSGIFAFTPRIPVDADPPNTHKNNSKRDSVNIVRFGVASPTTTQK